LTETSDFDQGAVGVLDIDPNTGRIPTLDSYQYVVRSGADTRFGLRGSSTVVSSGAIVVLTADRPYQANWLFDGPDHDNAAVPPGKTATVRAFGDPGDATAAIVLGRLGTGGGKTRFVIAAGAARRSGKVGAGQRLTVRLPVHYAAPGVAKLTLAARGGPLQFFDVSRAD
jgi:hypothetical protein